jgi:hypothetical protein
MEERAIKQIRGWRLTLGGEEHDGWLPASAAQPRAQPVREVTVNLEIRFDGHGWFLVFDSDDPEFHGDTWHQSLEEAQRQAEADFGIQPSQWENAS